MSSGEMMPTASSTFLEAEVHGRWSQERQKKRWTNTTLENLALNLTPVDTEDWNEWRRRTRVAVLRDSQLEEEKESPKATMQRHQTY